MSQFSKRPGALVIGGAAVLVAAVVTVLVLNRGDEAPIVAPPSATAEPSASPTPPSLVQPEPFDLQLRAVGVQEMGNGWIYRRGSGNTRKGAAKPAKAAVAQLQRYLNSELVDPETRFKEGPVNRLLTAGAEQALDRRGRRALGVGAPPILGGHTGRASARAIVLYDGKRAHAVTVTYRARINVIVDVVGSRQPLRQEGVIVFVPTKAGWRADMVDVRTELPQPRRDEPTEPTPSAGATSEPAATEGTS